MRPHPRRRYAYAIGYLLMACAGIASACWPAPAVQTATDGVRALLYTWDAFLVVGGLLSLFGAVTDRWVGEYTGLPLLGAVFAIYGVAATWAAVASGRPTSYAGGFALAAIAGLIAGRWRELVVVRRNATGRQEEGGGH